MKDYYIRKATETKNYKEYQIMCNNRLCDAIMISQRTDKTDKKEEEAMDLKERLLEEEKEHKAIIEQDFLDYVFEDEFLKEVFDDEKYL